MLLYKYNIFHSQIMGMIQCYMMELAVKLKLAFYVRYKFKNYLQCCREKSVVPVCAVQEGYFLFSVSY